MVMLVRVVIAGVVVGILRIDCLCEDVLLDRSRCSLSLARCHTTVVEYAEKNWQIMSVCDAV